MPSPEASCQNNHPSILRTCAQAWVFANGVILLIILPWIFGGSNVFAGKLVFWCGIVSVIPLALGFWADRLERRPFNHTIWLPLVCWSLLAAQVWLSLRNPSARLSPPWNGQHFTQLEHDRSWPSSGFPQLTRALGGLFIAYGLIFLTCFFTGLSRRLLKNFLTLILLNGVVMGLAGLPFKFSGDLLILGFWPASEWYFYSAFVYHNHWGAYALLCLAAAVALGFSTDARRPAYLLFLVFSGGILVATTLVATARLATLIQITFGICALIAFIRTRSHVITPKRLLAAALCGSLVVGAGVLGLQQKGLTPGGHRTWAKILTQNPFVGRFHLVEDTVPMIAAKPLFGWGLGSYRSGFRIYQRAETRIVHNQGRVTLYDHAHNDWIQTIAEFGFVGAALLWAPFASLIKRTRLGRALPTTERWLLFGCFALLLMAWGESLFLNRAVASAFLFLLGLALHPIASGRGTYIHQGNPEG